MAKISDFQILRIPVQVVFRDNLNILSPLFTFNIELQSAIEAATVMGSYYYSAYYKI